MSRGEALENPAPQSEGPGRRQRFLLPQKLAEAVSVEQRHREERDRRVELGRRDVEDPANVRVSDSSGKLQLASEAPHRRGLRRHTGAHRLEGDPLAQHPVRCLIDLAHAASGDEAIDRVPLDQERTDLEGGHIVVEHPRRARAQSLRDVLQKNAAPGASVEVYVNHSELGPRLHASREVAQSIVDGEAARPWHSWTR
jgi:hypothetical protein